jgi:hypothetical protein
MAVKGTAPKLWLCPVLFLSLPKKAVFILRPCHHVPFYAMILTENHHAPAVKRATMNESNLCALGIPECMLPVGDGLSQ